MAELPSVMPPGLIEVLEKRKCREAAEKKLTIWINSRYVIARDLEIKRLKDDAVSKHEPQAVFCLEQNPYRTTLPKSREIQTGSTHPGADAVSPARAVFRKKGEFWEIGYEGKTSNFQNVKGFHFISKLLREPGKEILARELAAQVNPPNAGVSNNTNLTSEAAEDGGFSIRGSLGAGSAHVDDVIDEMALKNYKDRLLTIASERKEAEENHDSGRLAKLDEEAERIEQEINAATGIGGKVRTFASPEDRARSNVTTQVKSALKRISVQTPNLGSHLRLSIKTGLRCSYQPDPTTAIHWIL